MIGPVIVNVVKAKEVEFVLATARARHSPLTIVFDGFDLDPLLGPSLSLALLLAVGVRHYSGS